MKLVLIVIFIISSLFSKSDEYFVVVIDKASSKHEAINIAKSASLALKFQLASETLENNSGNILYTGTVISVYKLKKDEFMIATFIGRVKSDAIYVLNESKKEYKDSRISKMRFDDHDIDPIYTINAIRSVIILGSLTVYINALKKAKSISKKSKIPFSSRGLIYNESQGLHWSSKDKNNPFAGSYFPRRYNSDTESSNYISIELSDSYPGFTKGYYIIVGGIIDEPLERKEMLKKYKKIVKDAYVKKTRIYMGCVN